MSSNAPRRDFGNGTQFRFMTTEEYLRAMFSDWEDAFTETKEPRKPVHNGHRPPNRKLPEIKRAPMNQHLYSGTPTRGEKFLLRPPHPLAGQNVVYDRREKPEGYYAVLDIFKTEDNRDVFITDKVQAISWADMAKPMPETPKPSTELACTNSTTR